MNQANAAQDRLRIGIIGAGVVAANHAHAYAKNAHCEIVAVADISPEKGRQLAQEHGAEFYLDYREMLKQAAIDAVSVCVPHNLHYDVGLAGADAGVHMLMEKPISITVAEADAMISACASAHVRLMLGFVHRFREEHLTAKRIIEQGVIGRPRHVLDNICTRGGSHPPAWVWQHDKAGGGVLMYGGIHGIDRLLWLLGDEVVEVFAQKLRYCNNADVEDGLSAVLRFSRGAVGSLFENSPSYGNPGGWLTEIYGELGAIRVKNGEWLEITTAGNKEIRTFDPHDHFQREIDEFVSAIREKREPWITGQDGRRALAVAQAIYQSADTGQPVTL